MRLVVFGDSIMQGFNDAEMGGWCNRLAQHTIKKAVDSDFEYDVEVFNVGISADTTEDLLKRMPIELEARLGGREEGVAVLAIGVNDSQCALDTKENKVPIDEFTTNVQACIALAKKYTSRIFVVGLLAVDDEKLWPMPWKENRGYSQEFVDMYNARLKEVSDAEGGMFINVSDLFKDDLKKYLPDGIHPNAEGHRLMFERVKEVLEKEKLI